MKILKTHSPIKFISSILFLLSFLAIAPAALAVNDVQIIGDTDFQVNTSDTATLTTVTAAAGGQITNFDVESNFIDITLDNASSIVFTVTTPSRFIKITKQSGSNNYTITPSCPTTSATLAGTGAQVILRLEITTTDTCPTITPPTPDTGGTTYGGGSATYTPPMFAKPTVAASTSTTVSTSTFIAGLPVINYFTRDLKFGIRGTDVMLLQMYLNNNGYLLATSSWGSPGHETRFFGPLTQASVIKFQKANSIQPAVGYFGPITRTVMNTCIFLLDIHNPQYFYLRQGLRCSI